MYESPPLLSVLISKMSQLADGFQLASLPIGKLSRSAR